METNEGALPKAIAAAWGLSQPPGKGPKRAFTIEQILEAGIRIAATEGFSAVSMNRVAAALGVTGMSMYRYFTAKDELVDLMIDHAFGPPGPPPPDGTPWREALFAWARAEFDNLRANPWIVDAPITGPPITPNAVTGFEHGLRCLAATPLSEGDKVLVLQIVSGLVRSMATLEIQLATQRSRYGGIGADQSALGRLVDAQRFPAITKMLQAGEFASYAAEENLATDVEFGLDRLLDGIEAFMDALPVTGTARTSSP